jgi:hypothetical protein
MQRGRFVTKITNFVTSARPKLFPAADLRPRGQFARRGKPGAAASPYVSGHSPKLLKHRKFS